MGERAPADGLGPGAVGDRPCDERRIPAHDLATRQRIARIGGQLGLHADDAGARPERLDRGRDPACEPAATDRDEDRGHVRQVLDDLEADRALAGDDPVVVDMAG